MTPTEQDKELREQVADALRTGYHGVAETKVINRVMRLITADRKRVALEARLDELKQLTEFEVATIGIIYGRHHRSYCDRITELKAQQEEL